MARPYRGKRQRSVSSENMSIKARRRNITAAPVEVSVKPTCFADLAPRGPLKVQNSVVGILRENGDGGMVIPDPGFKETNFGIVRIDHNHLNGAPFNMWVVCEILNPSAEPDKLRGDIKEVLGDIGSNDARMLAVLSQFGLSRTFPEAVTNEVKDLDVNPSPETVDSEIRSGRHDLRDLLTITIDGEEAKDLDDAISLERIDEDNWKLYVHIADVSHYVRANTALDNEAFLRATSVYLVDRVIPMLPPKLSNGLCSLNPKVDRLALTAEMYIDNNGNTYDGAIYESVIRSDRRMSYNECYRILTEPETVDLNELGAIVPMLKDMNELSDILKRMRRRRGAVNFDFPETKVILNDDGSVKDIMPYPINFCHGIIESFMICANEFVAESYASINYPFVYRVHEDPDPIKIARFASVAKNFGATGRLSGKITPLMVSNFMSTLKDRSASKALDTLLLRSMAKARYSSQNLGHFGLASKFYCHFTSPIRRYPDLYIHRIIKSRIHGEDRRRFFAGNVENVAGQSSEMERNSVDAERASVDIKACEFMKDKIGQKFPGIITSIIEAGVFVELESSVEGFVAFRSMRDHFLFDDRTYRAVGVRSGKKLMIGQDVEVVVAAVDEDSRHIDFVFDPEFEQKDTIQRIPPKKEKGKEKGKGKRKRYRY